MAKVKAQAFLDEETGTKQFRDIYAQRTPDAGWNVVQAATLLSESKKRRCGSLIIYAALELRLAIEQLIFTVIVVGRGGNIDDSILAECRKKDGLFRVLEEYPRNTHCAADLQMCSRPFIPNCRRLPSGMSVASPLLHRPIRALSLTACGS